MLHCLCRLPCVILRLCQRLCSSSDGICSRLCHFLLPCTAHTLNLALPVLTLDVVSSEQTGATAVAIKMSSLRRRAVACFRTESMIRSSLCVCV